MRRRTFPPSSPFCSSQGVKVNGTPIGLTGVPVFIRSVRKPILAQLLGDAVAGGFAHSATRHLVGAYVHQPSHKCASGKYKAVAVVLHTECCACTFYSTLLYYQAHYESCTICNRGVFSGSLGAKDQKSELPLSLTLLQGLHIAAPLLLGV